MGAAEKIMFAEEQVAGLQSHLSTVESVLETAEQVVATGEKAGRCLRRFVRVLLVISIVAAVVMIARKVMGDGRRTGQKAADEAESTPDAAVSDLGDETPPDDDAAPAGDEDAS